MKDLCPFWPEGRFVCAFSGGGDSTFLLRLLADFLPPDRLLAAHLDHQLRESSAAEADRAATAAEEMGLEFASARVDVKTLAKNRGKGIEEAARWARYDFLYQTLGSWPGDCIVTAHQAEDQAETVLMKMVRGGGPGALQGIPAVNDRVIRPLLGFSRKEIEKFLTLKGLKWIEDPSNKENRFTRNKIRNEILPILVDLNPSFLEAIGRAARLSAAEEDFWNHHLDELFSVIVKPGPDDGLLMSAAGLYELSVAEQRRMAGRALRRIKIPRDGGGEQVSLASVDIFLEILNSPGAGGLDLPGGRRVEWSGADLHVGPASRYKTKSGA
ncbi:MAG: tRNA lysidine(34) synthetase TilS [Deltaproteobacteria bacterium]|nr:tRNA lysidine(34) synthetase TilS [Deltaproteobacteria bacterium]